MWSMDILEFIKSMVLMESRHEVHGDPWLPSIESIDPILESMESKSTAKPMEYKESTDNYMSRNARGLIPAKNRPLPGSLHTVVLFLIKKMLLPKVEFGSNDLSGSKATCLLILLAHLKSTSLIEIHRLGCSGCSWHYRSCLVSGRVSEPLLATT